MRYIPTTPDTVEALRKKAKKLQRTGGGKHADLLNRVAKGAGYEHWHHVMECLKESGTDNVVVELLAECRRIVSAAVKGTNKLIVTGPELVAQPLILYACQGDAWVLEPSENLVLCLRFGSEAFPPTIAAKDGRVTIAWDGTFRLFQDSFVVDTAHPTVGTRSIFGYGLEELRKAIDRYQSSEARFDSLFAQPDAERITPELIEHLVASGNWDRAQLEQYARDGLRYLPSRNSFMTAPEFG
jgi:hypothetical protein